MSYILALDQGTTSSRAILFDKAGSVYAMEQQEFSQFYPQPGWVEHSAQEIWHSQRDVAIRVLQKSGIVPTEIAAIGITNQRETTIVWDRKTGEPIYRAIVWQDRRTAGICDELKHGGYAAMVQKKTGLVLDAYFSGTKIQWILDHVPGARQKAEAGELACGTVDSWLIWNLTEGRTHATDVSNASRTMLWNAQKGEWDPELLQLLRVPRSILPDVVPSSGVLGEASSSLLGRPIAIAGVAGDQQAALFGQSCSRNGMVKNTYGTGCFMLMNVGSDWKLSNHQLLSTVAWKLGKHDATQYALEGSVFIAGAAIQWLRDGLGLIQSSSEVEPLAATVSDSGGVYFVPALSGLGAPYWDPYARGTIVGLTRGTTKAHFARAALEAIALQTNDVLEAMKQDASIPIRELRCDGGACVNNLLMQFQSDILQVPVVRPKVIETTALGAAFLAGLAVGYWKDTDEIDSIWQVDRVFEPRMPENEVARIKEEWSKAVQRSQSWISS